MPDHPSPRRRFQFNLWKWIRWLTSNAVERAHKHCGWNRQELFASDRCGCFCCCAVFKATEITEWIDEDDEGIGQTAMCPRCGIDSVIGSASGFPITARFLAKMESHWFGIMKS
jgi:hypothetical protein